MKIDLPHVLTVREDRSQQQWRLAQWLLIAIYAVAIVVVTVLHEPWADEAQAWLLAGGVQSPVELLQYMRYEGSPVLWHLFLYPFAQLGIAYASMQALNAAIMIAAGVLLVRCSRMPFIHKILILFSYPLLYEYAALSRSYSLMVLFAFLAMALYPRRVQWSVPYLLVLLLLSQTNFFALLIAGILLAKFSYDLTTRSGISLTAYILTPVVWLLIAVTVFLLLPDETVAAHLQGWNIELSFERMVYALQLLVSFFMPLGQWQPGFWNSLVFTPATVAISVLALFAAVFALRRVRQATSLYLIGFIGLWAFMWMKELQRMRFSVVVFILFVLAWWIAQYDEEQSRVTPTLRTLLPLQGVFVTAVLVLQVVPVISPIRFDARYDFSPASDIASEVATRKTVEYELVAYPQTAALSTMPYMSFLETRKLQSFYALDREHSAAFAVWDTTYYENGQLSDAEIAGRLLERVNMNTNSGIERTVLFLSEREIVGVAFQERFELIAHYPDAIVDTERLYVYIEK